VPPLFLATPALATDPKPDAAITTNAIDAGVFLDDRVKADPALSADCLAEGKRWMDKTRPRPRPGSNRIHGSSATAAGRSHANIRSAPSSRIAM
jgi:hypothetical protein